MTSSFHPTRLALVGTLAAATLLSPAIAHEHEGHSEGAMADVTPEVAALIQNLQDTGAKLISLAEATPAEHFSWAPNDEVRTVSEVYMHVVGTNLLLPPAIGAAMPAGVEMAGSPFALMKEWEETVTTKEAVIAKLQESLEYVGTALASITDLETEVTLFGPPAPKRAYFLIIQGHVHEHLGQSIAYARSLGIVPPWSRPLPDEAEAPAEGDAD